MARLQTPQAFDEYQRKITQAPASASHSPVPAPLPSVLSTPQKTGWSMLLDQVPGLRDSPRAKRRVTLTLVAMVAVIIASYVLWWFAPALGFAQTLDAAHRGVAVDARQTPSRHLDAGAPVAPTQGRESAPQTGRKGPSRSTLVYLGAAALGLLAWRHLRRAPQRRRGVEGVASPPVTQDDASPPEAPLDTRRTHMGVYSVTGNTRENNQDRALVCRIAGADATIVADGLGGLEYGAEAAECATEIALERLEALLPAALPAGPHSVRALLLSIVWEVGAVLAQEGVATTPDGVPVGRRTTLIMAVSTRDHHIAVWIGDGIASVVREEGEIVQLLEPHKDPAHPEVLHASLGPVVEGRPSFAITARRPGDLLVVASDGVGDVFDARLATRARSSLRHASAAEVARWIVEDLARERDADGSFRVTDNLTLALTAEASS